MGVVDWSAVPERFHYFREVVESCGETRLIPYDPVRKRHVPFAERATGEQLRCLASIHSEVLRRDDLAALNEWLRFASRGSEAQKLAAWKVGGILIVLEHLADKEVSPFCDAPLVTPMEEDREPTGESLALPEDFKYLVGPALHFAERYSDDVRMLAFLDEASDEERRWLAAVAERVRLNGDWPRVLQWLTKAGPGHVSHNWEIETLFELMDVSDFGFE